MRNQHDRPCSDTSLMTAQQGTGAEPQVYGIVGAPCITSQRLLAFLAHYYQYWCSTATQKLPISPQHTKQYIHHHFQQQQHLPSTRGSSRTMPDWAEEVLKWDDVRQYIEEGTVESLGKLRRSEQQLTTYRSFMDKVSSSCSIFRC